MSFHAVPFDYQAIGAEALPTSELGLALARRGVASGRRISMIEARNANRALDLSEAFRHSLFLPAQTIARAQADLSGVGIIDPCLDPPQPQLLAQYGAVNAVRNRILPWRRIGGEVVVLTPSPAKVHIQHDELTRIFGKYRVAITSTESFHKSIQMLAADELVERAETLVPSQQSCRGLASRRVALAGVVATALLALGVISFPTVIAAVVLGWLVLTLILQTALRLAALFLTWPVPEESEMAPPENSGPDPVVTLFVPLFHECEIAHQLIRRLSALNYPRELLDVCLLLEADDNVTQHALEVANLPRWMRAISVPTGSIKTKPRALNYGLTFARGSIIGVYDAEDAPDPDQIRKVVDRFAKCSPKVACLQGVLDYYNSNSNWMARCFTIEYATWFRVVLPGLARMGLVVPLGGTTLFFRRTILESLGGWDAHNVTEDADLGLRLARAGYRTELVPTVTYEEANCRPWPWVKQRSRWLKGYAITYGVHMRDPAKLLADLGLKRFLGVQLLFLGTLTQILGAPFLWTFWGMSLGFWHPFAGVVPQWGFVLLGSIFLVAEVLGISISAVAARRAGKPELVKWTPTLMLYFPLAVLAVYKGLIEVFWKPFYWDKTAHGIFEPTDG